MYEAIGHIRIKKLDIEHLNIFYRQLLLPGSRRDITYCPIVDLDVLLDSLHLTRTAVAKTIGISVTTMFKLCPTKRATKSPANTTRLVAEKICGLLGRNLLDLFEPTKKDTGLDASTVHRYHEFIGTILSWAVDKNYLPYNICYRRAPKVGPRKDIEYYTEEQVDEFVESLAGADERLIVLACLAFFMGLRRAEICGLDINKDIDMQRGTLRVRSNQLYTSEDGCFRDTPKTKSSERMLQMPQPVMQANRHAKRVAEEAQENCGRQMAKQRISSYGWVWQAPSPRYTLGMDAGP